MSKEQWKLDNEFFESLFTIDIIKQLKEIEKEPIEEDINKCDPPSYKSGYKQGLIWMIRQISLKGRWRIKLPDETIKLMKEMIK